MATLREIQVEQRRQLVRLLRVYQQNPHPVIGLDIAIDDLEAEMDQEEVAWVRRKILGEGNKL